MAKYVVLSFDDGRYDTYSNALPIMEKHGIRATVNITTDFILHPDTYDTFKSAGNRAMSVEQVKDLHEKGFEIAVHGNRHINDPQDVKAGIKQLGSWEIHDVCGFASPHSEINEGNFSRFEGLLGDGTVKYIRSGLQVRKQGLIYTGLYVLQNIIKSKFLFYILNKKTVIGPDEKPPLIFGVSVSRDTTPKQITYLIKKAPEGATVVLIFHSILENGNPELGRDKWYWETDRFDRLCGILAADNNIKTVTNREIY